MDLAPLAEHAGVAGGIAITITVSLRYGSDAVLRFVAGLVAIIARDKRSRVERALDVLKALRRDRELPPGPEAAEPAKGGKAAHRLPPRARGW